MPLVFSSIEENHLFIVDESRPLVERAEALSIMSNTYGVGLPPSYVPGANANHDRVIVERYVAWCLANVRANRPIGAEQE
jgi:hypothetical protein